MEKGSNFGPYTISKAEIFAETSLSFAFVNLRPVVPGHVLVSPKRCTPRFSELTKEEITDLCTLAQKVGEKVEKHFQGDSLTLCIQDGPSAGQTVPHVHVHCLPRKRNDFDENNEVYELLEKISPRGDTWPKRDPRQKDQTIEEMASEADALRQLFD